MACRKDIEKIILDEVDQIFVDGRHTYYRLDDNTFRIANTAETAGKSKAKTRNQAREIALSLRQAIINKYGNNIFVQVSLPEESWLPIELTVTPTPQYIEKLYAQVKPEKRTEYVSREAFLQDEALYQQELREDEPLNMVPYEAWAAQNRAPNPILDEEGKPKFDTALSENNLLVPKVEQGAILFASDLLVLREFGNEVDKALTMPDELFFERSKQRNNFIEGELGTKVWKGNLNRAVNNFKEKFGEDKVISTEKYLSDLFITPQQKQQALQLYSQYLESLNKPNTNPILQGNQQEQVKKFAELQKRLNNKEFIEGAKSAYESTPALQELGTQEEYNDYIARVSLGIIKNPSSGEYNYTSQLKDIVYHGTAAEFEQFKPIKPNFDTLNSIEGIYNFSTNKEFVKRYGKRTITAILNLKNPIKDTTSGEFIDDMDRPLSEALFKTGKQKSKNVLAPKYDESLKDTDGVINNITGEEYVAKHPISGREIGLPKQAIISVFEPEQIHILGSKQDIEGFKEFVKTKPTITPITQVPDVMATIIYQNQNCK